MFTAALIGLNAVPTLAGSAAKAITGADVASTSGLLHRIHGCHFDTGPGMEPDPVNGHHYHDRSCRVIRLGPPPRGHYYDDRPPRRYRDREPPSGPYCREQCRYVGPIKRCRTVCD
jgi:hypothetical protein